MKNFWKKIINIATSPVGMVFLTTLIIHMIIAVVLDMGTFQFSLAGDQAVYHEWGAQIAHLLKSGTYHWNDVYPFHWYPLFVGVLYVVFGSSMFVGSLFNVFLIACSAVVAYGILRRLDLSEKYSAIASFVIMNGYASFVFHGSVLLKESWIVFFVVAMMYLSIRIARGQGNRVVLFALFVLLYLLLRDLRYFVAFAMAITFLSEWFINARMAISKRAAVGVVMAGVIIGITLATVGDGMIRSAGFSPTSIPTESYSIQVLSSSRPSGDLNNSESGRVIKNDSALRRKTGSLVATFVGPLPGQVTSKKFMILFPDVAVVWIILAISVAGIVIRRLQGIGSIFPITLGSVLILGPIAFASTNMGWIVRQRIPGVVLGAMVAAYYAPFVWAACKNRLAPAKE